MRKPPKVEPYAPPDPMGLGRDEDTIGNVRSLVPKQPHANQEKLALYDSHPPALIRTPVWTVREAGSVLHVYGVCRYGNQALRFVARFAYAPGFEACGEADLERTFIFSFFLATDEVFIFEPPVQNSGISGGKFFERAQAFKPGTRTHYGATDFFVGARIPLVSRCASTAFWILLHALQNGARPCLLYSHRLRG